MSPTTAAFHCIAAGSLTSGSTATRSQRLADSRP